MPEALTDTERVRRFEMLFDSQIEDIHRYALRRIAPETDARDVVADIFTVAWRRLDDIPVAPEDRLWLFGIARRTVSQANRTVRRRRSLNGRLEFNHRADPTHPIDGSSDHMALQLALETLRPDEAEAVRLVYWDDLSHADAGRVLECSANAVALRIHRAKRRLAELLDVDVQHQAVDPTELERD